MSKSFNWNKKIDGVIHAFWTGDDTGIKNVTKSMSDKEIINGPMDIAGHEVIHALCRVVSELVEMAEKGKL